MLKILYMCEVSSWHMMLNTAAPSKNTVSANIKHLVDASTTHQIPGQSTTVVVCTIA